MARYRSCREDDTELRQRLKALAKLYPRYGHLTLYGLLRADGHVVNRKRTYRLYREKGLQVRTKRRKKLIRPRVPLAVPEPGQQAPVGGLHGRPTPERAAVPAPQPGR